MSSAFSLLSANARAYTHIPKNNIKQNYICFDKDVVISTTDEPPCEIFQTSLTLKEFNILLSRAISPNDISNEIKENDFILFKTTE